MADPIVKPIGDSVWVIWPEQTFEFSRFHESRDTLTAELAVVAPTRGGLLHWARLNLASTQGRNAVAKSLEEADPTTAWRVTLEQACRLVARHLRAGEPAEPLVAAALNGTRWLVEPLVPLGDMTVLFGDGGAGKSLLALALAIAGIQGHPLSQAWRVGPVQRVLYLDWESDRATHGDRLWSLTSSRERLPDGVILHRRLWRPLTDGLEQIRADADRHHADLIICDSLGAACGPEPEGADAAVRTLMALRGLPGTKLIIAHVSKASAEQSRSRPFGSVYVQNLARSVIEARRLDTPDEESEMTVSLYHRKANSGRLSKASALTFSWEVDGSITVQGANPDLTAAGLGLQILEALLLGNASVATLANDLEATRGTVRKELARLKKRGKVTEVATHEGENKKETLWGLLDTKRGNYEP